MEEAKVGTPNGILGGIPKKWSELTSDEKLEVLRGEIINLRYNSRQIYSLRRKFEDFTEHSHDSNGKAIVPFSKYDNNNGDCAVSSFDRLA